MTGDQRVVARSAGEGRAAVIGGLQRRSGRADGSTCRPSSRAAGGASGCSTRTGGDADPCQARGRVLLAADGSGAHDGKPRKGVGVDVVDLQLRRAGRGSQALIVYRQVGDQIHRLVHVRRRSLRPDLDAIDVPIQRRGRPKHSVGVVAIRTARHELVLGRRSRRAVCIGEVQRREVGVLEVIPTLHDVRFRRPALFGQQPKGGPGPGVGGDLGAYFEVAVLLTEGGLALDGPRIVFMAPEVRVAGGFGPDR